MGKILYVNDGDVRAVESMKFEQEAVLQSYLEQYPELLPLHEVEDDPARLLAIGREVPVPSGAIDLLFVDPNGLLTIIETKLAKNPEVRREVIGQIIEYASFVSQWNSGDIERIAADYLATRSGNDADLYETLARITDGESSAEAVRQRVEENLRKGRIRLVIAVDEMREPLRSTVSFLNSFSTFDLLILQVEDFDLGGKQRVFIPSVFGYAKPPTEPQRRSWDEGSLFADAREKRTEAEAKVIGELYEFAVSTGRAQFGTGTTGGSFTHQVSSDGKRWLSLVTVFNTTGPQFSLGHLRVRRVPDEVLSEFRARVNAIPGVHIPEDQAVLSRFPSIPFAPLTQGDNLQRFKDSLVWLRDQVLKVSVEEEAE